MTIRFIIKKKQTASTSSQICPHGLKPNSKVIEVSILSKADIF